MASKRVALVTGSGKRRVGQQVADALAGRGYDIAVHYHTSRAEAGEAVARMREQGVEAAAFQADLAIEAEARGLVRATVERFGRVDVLVNAASTYQKKRFEDITAADVRHNFEANILATFLCSQEAGLAMTKQPEGGSIVTFSDWAEARPYLHYAAYFASKGGVPALTRCLAVELGTRNPRVRVNCVVPGPVLFPPAMPEAERREAIAATLLQREGTPVNVAQAVLCLVENDFITGACLVVDGGRTIYAGGL